MDKNNFVKPKPVNKEEKSENNSAIKINSEDFFPEENNFGDLVRAESKKEQNNKPKAQPCLSNNQKYAKKEEIEYGKKSHLEYLTFINQNKDPLNVRAKGGLRPVTMTELKKHNTPSSMWTVLNGNVYDLTMYIDYHPGGAKKLMLGAGRDCTSLFNKYHPWVNANMLVGKLQIGYLVKD